MMIKRQLSIVILTAVLFFMVVTISTTLKVLSQGLGQPLNTNGSFENTEPGVVTDLEEGVEGWVLELLDNAEADFEIVDDEAQHGNHSLKVVPTTLGTQAWHIQAVADSIPVVPGEAYRFSIWARAEEEGARLDITVGNYAFAEYNAIRPANLAGTDWQEFTFEFTITDDEEYIRAPIHFSFSENDGNTIYIDNLQIINIADAIEATRPIVIEAESGTVGEDFDIIEEDGVTFVRITNDWWDDEDHPDAWQRPISEEHVITYEVTFPAPGEYNLFVRGRVGPDDADDDSFFYPEGFGEKDVEDPDDWRIANQLDVGGYTDPSDFVVGRGGAGIQTWKWMNISEGDFHEDGITFVVEEDSLTLTFQIGGRETGFDIDKIAFGKADLYYTVMNLDSVQAGSTEMEEIFIYDGPPLATGHPKYLGNIWANPQVPSTPPLFESYWNQVTPENASKWGSVAGSGTTPDPETWNWGSLDNAYNFAQENGFPFRFHVLVWGSQQPPWIGDLDQEEQLEAIENWFEAVAERYPDIDWVEVVNEPIPDQPVYKDALGGDGETGWDWVITAFEMARDIFPESTKLVINDYGILGGGPKRNQYLQIVDLLIERDLLDAIGAQGHHFTMQNISPEDLEARLNELATRDLPIIITEYDIAGRTEGDANIDDPNFPEEESDATQLEAYQRTFPVIWEHPAVEGVTLWGWRLGGWRPGRQMHLVRANGSERPALEWLREYVKSTVSVEYIAETPQEFHLSNNYPNPFNPSTQIRYHIPEAADVTLKIYDLLGRKIETIVDERQQPGQYTVTFNAVNLSSGIYLYRLQAGSFVEVKRMTFIK